METVELRPLSLGELLDHTFRLYRNHFWLFVCIMAIPSAFMIPANVAVLSLQGSIATMTPGRPPTMPPIGTIAGIVIGYLIFMAIFCVVYSAAIAAATCAVSDVYLGRPSTVRGAFARIQGKVGRLMGLILNIFIRIVGVFIAVIGVAAGTIGAVSAGGFARGNTGLIILIVLLAVVAYIGGLVFWVYFTLRYAVSIPVLMIENLGVLATIRRSIFLTRGRRGHIFLALLVAAVIAYAGIAIFQGPFIVLTMVAAVHGHWPPWLAFASSAAGAIGSALTGPISMIAIVLLYYDARIRKEAFDLQFMMTSIDNSAPAVPGISPA